MSTVTKTGWTGWVIFAGVILLISGIFSIVQGIVAVVGPNSYVRGYAVAMCRDRRLRVGRFGDAKRDALAGSRTSVLPA